MAKIFTPDTKATQGKQLAAALAHIEEALTETQGIEADLATTKQSLADVQGQLQTVEATANAHAEAITAKDGEIAQLKDELQKAKQAAPAAAAEIAAAAGVPATELDPAISTPAPAPKSEKELWEEYHALPPRQRSEFYWAHPELHPKK